MNTLLFINANSCDVEIFKSICCMLVNVTAIIAGCSVLTTGLKALFDWMKSMEIGKNAKDQNEGKIPDSHDEERKHEMQRQDRAKALVKDFYESTKDLTKAGALIKMYEGVLGYNSNGTNVDTDGKEK